MSHFGTRLALAVAVGLLLPAAGAAQERGEAAVFGSWLHLSEFGEDDFGLGLRLGYRASRRFGLDAEIEHAPGDLGRAGFSSSRTSGAVRLRAGALGERWGAFLALAPGFTRFGAASEPLACIAVFPPPLECQVGAGLTVFALGWGGGIELRAAGRLRVRVDLEDRMLHYPEAFRREGRWQHHVRMALSAGLRF